jgi:hypothetical protein
MAREKLTKLKTLFSIKPLFPNFSIKKELAKLPMKIITNKFMESKLETKSSS